LIFVGRKKRKRNFVSMCKIWNIQLLMVLSNLLCYPFKTEPWGRGGAGLTELVDSLLWYMSVMYVISCNCLFMDYIEGADITYILIGPPPFLHCQKFTIFWRVFFRFVLMPDFWQCCFLSYPAPHCEKVYKDMNRKFHITKFSECSVFRRLVYWIYAFEDGTEFSET
jgi:hypothetical protein